MSGKRSLALKREARRRAMDGSVVASYEYKKIKKQYVHPSYAAVVVLFPTAPGIKFIGKENLKRLAEEKNKKAA